MIDLIHGLRKDEFPKHYIEFGSFDGENNNFDSRRFRLNLHERTATTPSEKEVTASIPYMQGVVDISNLIGNRVYENREITYTFYRFGVQKGSATAFQTTIENLLMQQFNQRLNDSYEPDFHYRGKCQEVVVIDDYEKNRLRVEITFDLYPFKIDNRMESADHFDPFNFDLDAFQEGLSFSVTANNNRFHLYNSSQRVHVPGVQVVNGANVVLRSNSIEHLLSTNNWQNYPNFRLFPGMNVIELSASGTATVRFDWRKERI